MAALATAIMLAAVLAFTVQAAPFMVCDPQEGIESFKVFYDGAVTPKLTVARIGWIQNGKLVFTDPGGTRTAVIVVDDLATVTNGEHTVKAQACNSLWGCSGDSTPLPFTKFTLGVPTSTLIVGQ